MSININLKKYEDFRVLLELINNFFTICRHIHEDKLFSKKSKPRKSLHGTTILVSKKLINDLGWESIIEKHDQEYRDIFEIPDDQESIMLKYSYFVDIHDKIINEIKRLCSLGWEVPDELYPPHAHKNSLDKNLEPQVMGFILYTGQVNRYFIKLLDSPEIPRKARNQIFEVKTLDSISQSKENDIQPNWSEIYSKKSSFRNS